MLRFEFPAWTAAFGDRSDGDLRVSARADPEPLAVVQARALAAIGVGGAAVARQVHGVEIVRVERPSAGYLVGVGEGDGVVTALAGVAAAVHVADCLPIGIGGEGAVAMLHGGWRGLAGGIVASGVRALRAAGARGELQAAIGPGAGGCCYETGDEVRELFTRHAASDGRLLDLKSIAAAQLREAGVAVVEDAAACTICDERYFSHRRDGTATGRQGGFAWRR
jgi:purine-nucleoside/S-methyl-5'-thioadenosine phosphorylase / adenosine deaminase